MLAMQSNQPDWCLTLSADTLCDPGDPRKEGQGQGSAVLRMECARQRTCLTPVGDWDAEMLLEGLPKAITTMGRTDHLKLLFHEMEQFEDFFISVLMVLLRRHAHRFQSIMLDGLPFWAGARISQAQWDSLLGEGWVVQQSPGMVTLIRGH